MKAVPIELKDANAFVESLHRHHVPVHRDKIRLGCIADDGHLCGVIQLARPVSRILDDGETIEVVRCCTDGEKNACSFLYSRAARIAKEIGYKKIITYILESESGASLKASGWKYEADITGRTWDTPTRRRSVENVDIFGEVKKYPTENKQRWSKQLAERKEE